MQKRQAMYTWVPSLKMANIERLVLQEMLLMNGQSNPFPLKCLQAKIIHILNGIFIKPTLQINIWQSKADLDKY